MDALRAKSRLNRGPNIVAIGGGTGLSTLLSGLKRYSSHITAIVTVADDGGSSGVLRRELGVLPPGDIRNCLAALSTEEPLLTRLFQYRFAAGSVLEGHSFGNLFLSALSAITGNLETAITASSRVLAVQGQVVPATNVDVQLWAELENGQRIEGESNIGHAPSPIVRLGCSPERPPALPRALEAITNADLIVLGPGSLYTSLLPNLLVPELVGAIKRSKAPRLYICNLMTQPGETDGLDVRGHIRAIEAQLATLGIEPRLFNAVLAQDDLPDSDLVRYYQSRGADPVRCDAEGLRSDGYDVTQAPLQGVTANSNAAPRFAQPCPCGDALLPNPSTRTRSIGVLHFIEIGLDVVLAQRPSFPVLRHQQPFGMRVPLELDAVHVEGFTLLPIGAAEQSIDGWERRGSLTIEEDFDPHFPQLG